MVTWRIWLALILCAACDGPAPEDAGPGPTDAGTDAGRDAGVPLGVAAIEDLGQLPLPSDTVAGRDGASSGVIDGQLLWTFGDTFVYEPTPVDGSNVVSATGGWATPDAPLELLQPVDANGIPSQLIPYSDEELAINRVTPLDGWSLWPAAVIDTGADALLVLFQRIERIEGGGFEGRAVGTARIAPTDPIATRDEAELWTGGEPLFGSGGFVVEEDFAYLLACQPAGLGHGCRLARAPRADADDRAAYRFWDGAGWSEDVADAEVMIDGVGAAVSIHHNAHLDAYLAVTSAPLSNDLVLRTAPAIEGPWPSRGLRVRADEWDAIQPAGEGTNYLMQEQAALSSADGREVVISYSRPLGAFRGEVRLARVVLE